MDALDAEVSPRVVEACGRRGCEDVPAAHRHLHSPLVVAHLERPDALAHRRARHSGHLHLIACLQPAAGLGLILLEVIRGRVDVLPVMRGHRVAIRALERAVLYLDLLGVEVGYSHTQTGVCHHREGQQRGDTAEDPLAHRQLTGFFCDPVQVR